MSVYKDMAYDAGYRGEEAEQMARAIEEQHQAEMFRQQEAAEAEAEAEAAIEQEMELQREPEEAARVQTGQTQK